MTGTFMAFFRTPYVDIKKVRIDIPKGIMVRDVVYVHNIKKYGRIPGYWLVSFTVDEAHDKIPGYCQRMFDELESKLGVKVIRGWKREIEGDYLIAFKRKLMGMK